MKPQKKYRLSMLLAVGLMLVSLCLVGDVLADDQDQTQDQTQDQLQDHDQDRLHLHEQDCLFEVSEDDAIGWDAPCDCLCQCCQDGCCTCANNCLCPCCQEQFCTCSQNRLCICNNETVRARIQNQFRARPGEPGGGEDETAGNCLSHPLIVTEGDVTLRGAFGESRFEGAYVTVADVNWYEQQDELNEWQAERAYWNPGDPNVSCVAAWGDNLARPWTLHSVVRVETVLTAYSEPMLAYEMMYLHGEGPDEMQGTNTLTFGWDQPTVYTSKAWLTIQKWLPDSGEEDLVRIPEAKLWAGADDPVVNGLYTAEINVKGKVIFGYNWFVRHTNDGPGMYRITMWLEDSVADLNPDPALDFAYVDVQITEGGGGGGGGGGDGGDGGGSNLVADFGAVPTEGTAPLQVFFDDASTGRPTGWLWYFGDGNTSTERDPIHVYLIPGSYTVTLRVSKGTQTDTETKVNYITVTGENPVPGTTVHVDSVDMTETQRGRTRYINTTVVVRDENGAPVSNATVELTTTLPDASTQSKSKATGEDGTVTFSVRSRQAGEYISVVDNVSHPSRVYESSANVETMCSLVLP